MAATIGQALDGLKAARLEEGAALDPDADRPVDRIEDLTVQAEREAAGQPAVLKERFAPHGRTGRRGGQ
jgi:uncharacterized protein YicC (UPF0701 family)